MKPPCELMVKSFLPPTRGLLAHRLKALGLGQDEAARLIGVTQAAVSYYLSASPERHKAKLLRLGLTQEQVDAMIEELASAVRRSDAYATEVLYNYWRLILSSGGLCGAHRALVGGLEGCDMCIRVMASPSAGWGGRERFEVLRALKEALALLEASPTFGYIIPEVYSNLVYSTPNPEGEMDVAAVPGRILRVKDRARVLMDPEFGASEHMAKLLLSLRKNNQWVRSALNVKNDQSYLESLLMVVRADVVVLSQYSNVHQLFEQTSKARLNPPVAFIVDPGAVGFEPNIYIVASDPVTVANIAVSASTLWFHSKNSAVRRASTQA